MRLCQFRISAYPLSCTGTVEMRVVVGNYCHCLLTLVDSEAKHITRKFLTANLTGQSVHMSLKAVRFRLVGVMRRGNMKRCLV